MKKVLIIDNYDSFTYNLVHAIENILGHEISVWRNDKIDYSSIGDFEYIVLSPGPGIPEEAGDLLKVIKLYGHKVRMLGVCLGHQAIGEVFGAKLENLTKVYHGVQTAILRKGESKILNGLSPQFEGGRYHSWVIKKDTLPDFFHVTSVDEEEQIMSMRHADYELYSVQFHPESILTPDGNRILENFLNS